ncbi:gfo/Idh/MocA family oxidoreductase [Paenibacillus dendritiformis]|uniref:Gfo/Idh/MocA family protein n=1 Tax=Paenibacillus dendritiformis TaxID=130049 RepID=UPI00105A2985|nr:Gfo/Idh/MocA family oxidoreductase [Paenibacillus dendritiformis]TDL52953.1 gfo/Idh/MocA family oxidoreductase [Paenibacillus dendritiformis]
MLRIGIIGLDTSHVTAFTALLNDDTHPYHVPGGKVVAAYQGGTPGLELSMSRLKAYTDELVGQYGVTLVPDLPSLSEQCDVLLLESVDGGVHEAQFAAVAPFGKPVFIDKPLALSTASANRIADLAAQYGTPVMSSSALRYAEALTSAVQEVTAEAEGRPCVQGVDAFGPTPRGDGAPGLFYYGIHCAEMLYAAMGPGCREVRAEAIPGGECITARWEDGRVATIRGRQGGAFGALVHGERQSRYADVAADVKPFYASLLEGVMAFFQTREPDVPLKETLELIAFLEAANASLAENRTVRLP